MLHLSVLGGLDLSDAEGRKLSSVLQQPRRFALLAYLALARPRGFHRRDTLLAMFWPDMDAASARGALNQAVYMLRRSLGKETLLSRGDEELGLVGGELSCDAVAFESALEDSRYSDALVLYRGDLLEGFFISDAPEFERWLEAERVRLRQRAAEAAWAQAEAEEKQGNAAQALLAARRAAALTPDDEGALRRLVLLLGRLGERAGAVRAYEEFAERLRAEYGVEPSAETRALIEAIRLREEPMQRPPASGFSREKQPPDPAPSAAPESPPSQPGTDLRGRQRRSRRWAAPASTVAGVLVALSGYAVYGSHGSPEERIASRASESSDPTPAVAVLPFVNMSADEENEYFSDGLTEEILNGLAGVEGLKVAARTSSFAFKGVDADIREIGRKLGVRHVVEGSVRKAGDRIRIMAQLIEAESGYRLWSATYDRNLGDIFAVQDEIGRAVVGALRPRLVGEGVAPFAVRPTHDVQAYNLYLKGRYHFNLRSADDARRAVGYFQEAIARDSSFALAHAGLADVYALLPYYRAARPQDILPEAEAAAKRAIELDSTLAEPHSTLGWINFAYKWDWNAAEREFEEALRLNPNYTNALHFYSLYLARVQGRHEEATALAARAQHLDPLAPVIHTGAGAVFYHARQFDRAIAAHQHALALDSTYSVARYMLAESYLATGRPGDAIREFNQIERGNAPSGDHIVALIGYAYLMSGRHSDARRMIERAEHENISPVVLAILYTGLGEKDHAFAALERAADERTPGMVELKNEPLLDPLRSDPRFTRLAERLGLP
jgi:TolB-like protein/DNA-binding SARP family transcriptional activator